MNAHETRVSFHSLTYPALLSLTEEQLSTFWAGIVANLDAARRMARKIVPRESVDDVVHSAAVLYVEALQRQTSPFPKSEDELRGFFLTTVQRHARDCVRVRVVDRAPVHSHWADAPEPRVNGSTTPDRALDQVFARNDQSQPLVVALAPPGAINQYKVVAITVEKREGSTTGPTTNPFTAGTIS